MRHCQINNNNNTGLKPLNIEENLRGELGSGHFMITPTRLCGKGCPHVRPHPGVRNLEFGRVNLYFHFRLSQWRKIVGVNPG